jgi:hypothetical protein
MRTTIKLLALGGLTLAAAAVGCNDPLRVSLPDIVTPGQLTDSAALATLRAGAIGDFAIAYSGDHPDGSGGTEGVIMYGGLLADEWINSETFPTRIEVDARSISPLGGLTTTNADVDLWFRRLHQARRSAENAAGQYAALAPTDPGHAEMLSLAGFTYIFFAETWCSGVPVSHLNPDGSITYGRPLTTVELLDTAIARFDGALAVAAPNSDMAYLASVGKGRALLDLGRFAEAAAAVAGVPTPFAYIQEHSENTDRENNGVFNGNFTDGRYAIADSEGINGFPFRSVADPRTPWTDPGTTGFDNSTELWTQLRYGDRRAPVTVATGVEARMIEAEAAYQGGDSTSVFLAKLNEPRANPAERTYFDPQPVSTDAPPIGTLRNLTLADETAAGGAVNLLFAERARWLWLTAHRLGDLRRLVRQYNRPADAVFPTGPYFKPTNFTTYGTDVNFPVPVTEKNNPNFTSCIDRLP